MEVEAARLWLRAKSEPPPRHETGAAVDVGADIGVAAGLCRPYAVQCRDRTAPAQAGGTQAAEVELVNAHRKVRDPVHGLCRRVEGVHVDEVIATGAALELVGPGAARDDVVSCSSVDVVGTTVDAGLKLTHGADFA